MHKPMTVEVPTDGLTVRFVQHVHPQAQGPGLAVLRQRVIDEAKAWAELTEHNLMDAVQALTDAEHNAGIG